LKLRGFSAPLLLALGLCTGCGSGFSVHLSAVPDPANAGQSVQWTLTVRNDTACPTANDVTLPSPFPSNSPPLAIIIGFDPNLGASPADICRVLQTCQDESCVAGVLGDAVGPDTVNQLMARAQAEIAHASAEAPLQSGMCVTESNDSSGFLAVCTLDPLAPGATDTVTFVDTAPNSVNHQAAQLAIAAGAARGNDCRPGTEVTTGQWALAGCFPTAPTSPVPVLSPRILALCAVLIGALGIVTLYRQRRA